MLDRIEKRYRYTKRIQQPTDISDCALWLDASLGVTTAVAAVTAWADQSGNSVDFSPSAPRDWSVADWAAGTYMGGWTVRLASDDSMYLSAQDLNTTEPPGVMASGVTDGTTAGSLVDADGDFVNNGVTSGMWAVNSTDGTYTTVSTGFAAVASGSVKVTADIFASGDTYSIDMWRNIDTDTSYVWGVGGKPYADLVAKFYDDGGGWACYTSSEAANNGTPGTSGWAERVAADYRCTYATDSDLGGANTIVWDADYATNIGGRMDTGVISPAILTDNSTWFMLYKRTDNAADVSLSHNFAIDGMYGVDTGRMMNRISNSGTGALEENWFGMSTGSAAIYPGAYTAGEWKLDECTFNNAAGVNTAFRNGHMIVKGTPTANSNTGINGLILGDKFTHNRTNANNWFDGSIAALIIYDRILNPEERFAVREYMYNRYGFKN